MNVKIPDEHNAKILSKYGISWNSLKSFFKQSLRQETLSNTAILSTENETSKEADFENTIDEFLAIKTRKLKW